LRVQLAADPVSVPGARRFVADALRSWGLLELIDDTTLCVSELAGNAALHAGSTFMGVEVRQQGNGVRLSVEDDGSGSAVAVLPRPTLLIDEAEVDLVSAPTTGRGLAIVSILASDWGVETTTTGKRVWAVLDGEASDREHASPSPPHLDLPTASPVPAEAALPPGWVLVRLQACPVRLSLRQDQHLDELIRELQLIDAGPDTPTSREIAAKLRGLLIGPAHARNTGRRIAERAAAAGLENIDIDMAMPTEFAAAVRELHIAVQAADLLCEQQDLLTLTSAPPLRQLRAWMTEQVTTQIEQKAAPVSWTQWLTRQNRAG
jgi:anti-sigma regulatory factor (Ser/Thr protein kinase)